MNCRLEVFNSVIFHHLSDNPNLLYAIITAHVTFQELGTFTLAHGLREIKRIELAKEEQARQSERDRKGRGSREDDLEAGDPHAEKARLLRNDSDAALATDREAESSHDPNNASTQDENGGEGPVVARPVISPSSESTPSTSTSEKARGKMRERRSLSLEINSSVERNASVGIGRNGFVPTQEWVSVCSNA
jgi:hypothetical protein